MKAPARLMLMPNRAPLDALVQHRPDQVRNAPFVPVGWFRVFVALDGQLCNDLGDPTRPEGYTTTVSLIPSFGACTKSCFVPRYRSVVWTDAWPSNSWICSSSPPAARQSLAHDRLLCRMRHRRRYAESRTMPNRYKGSCLAVRFGDQSDQLIRHSLEGIRGPLKRPTVHRRADSVPPWC